MSEKFVSVIIPCYNNASYIRKCINSVLDQSFSNYEIIVVDDGSSDNTEDIIAEYTGKGKIRYLKNTHSGVSAARNTGIENAKGEYILFIDGDDWIDCDHISSLIKGAAICDCPIIRMKVEKEGETYTEDEDNASESVDSWKLITKDEFNLIYESYLLSSPCNKLYRTEIIRKHNIIFRPDISYAEDLIFNLIYFRYIRTASITPKATYHYVKHPTQSGTTRYHTNVVTTLDTISTLTHTCITNITDKTLAIEMQHYLWGILNIFHNDANLSPKQRRDEIKLIINSRWWKQFKRFLPKNSLNSVLYYLLIYGNPFLIEKVISMRKHKS